MRLTNRLQLSHDKTCGDRMNSFTVAMMMSLGLALLTTGQVNGDCTTGCSTGYGNNLGSSNGNIAYSNCKTSCVSGESNYLGGHYMGMKWQCVEYARRYWYSEYGILFGSVANAYQIWDDITSATRVSDNTSISLSRFSNGGTTVPAVGDLLVYNSSVGGGSGHVAVIVAVNTAGSAYVRVAEQNWNNTSWGGNSYSRQLAMTVSGSNYTIAGSGIYGWKRGLPTIAADYISQSESTLPWRKPGEMYPLWINYKNIGTATWNNTGGVSNPNYMELRSVDAPPVCSQFCSDCANHSSWINCQRIGGFGGGTIPPQSTATFNFTAQMPNINGPCIQYVAPWSAEGCEDDGSQPNFTLRVDGTLPSPPGNVTATPPSGSSQTFSLSWSASVDDHSGLRYYRYRVNGGTITTTNELSVSANATQQGVNTFEVQSEDKAGTPGNQSPWQPVQFTWNVGPCSGLLPPCGTLASSSSILSSGSLPKSTASTDYAVSSASIVVAENQSLDSWKSVPLVRVIQLSPSAMYSVGFWYRSTSSDTLLWALGPELIEQATTGDLLVSTIDHPTSDGQWHQFWSAPLRIPTNVTERPNTIYFNDYSNDDVELRDGLILQIE